MSNLEKWIKAILNEDADNLSIGSVRTLQMIKAEFERLQKENAEATELLKGYEQWEADIISCDEMWWPKSHKDALPNSIYETMLELQNKRNKFFGIFQ